ncbi:hypothetical protein ACHQM5_006348 [Ranunculus cassubicifolius]
MAHLALVGALLMFLLAIAQASTYRTIITTEIDEPNTSQSESCRQQMRGMKMDFCAGYLKPYVVLSQMGKRVQKCCDELDNLSQECRCKAIQQTVEELNKQPLQQEERQAIMSRAQQLPQMCGFQLPCEQLREDQY